MALSIGTFNVWGLPETFGVGDDVSSRMRMIARALSRCGLDLLLIQEAWTKEVRETLAEGARTAGFEVAEGPGASGGLMTLSRRPIHATRFDRFGFRGDPERVSQGEFLGGKGFQTTVIDGDNGPLRVINTHVHARYRREQPQLNSAVRTAQLLEIVGHLDASPETFVVGGDFNCTAGDPEYLIFCALSGAIELGGGSDHPTLSRSNYYKRHRSGQDKRIDFLFVRPSQGTEWAARDSRLIFAEPARIRNIDRSLSDHFGFRAELSLSNVTRTLTSSRPAPPDPRAFELARRLLEVGRAEADRRERSHSLSALGWAGTALLACGVRRTAVVDRRRLLRAGARAAAVLAVGPALAFGSLARLDSDRKRDAFDDAYAVLALLEGDVGRARS